MMKSTANIVVTLLLILMASCSRQRDNKLRAAPPPAIYATPAAVFDAWQEAARKRDWRKCFDCFTPDRQKNGIFELVSQCRTVDAQTGGPLILKKFVDANWEADFKRKYQEKFGMEPKNIYGYPTVYGSLKPAEHQLRCDILAAHVKDKAGFVEAVCNLPERVRGYPPPGRLMQVTVDGDTATGKAEMISESKASYGNGVYKVVCTRYDTTYYFRKVNGGWLIEQDL